jgi:hypothetical protein
MNCWELKKCGREKGGEKVAEFGVCPAYPNDGRRCAFVVGTLCGGQVQGSIAMKLKDCLKCEVFKSPDFDRSQRGQPRKAKP